MIDLGTHWDAVPQSLRRDFLLGLILSLTRPEEIARPTLAEGKKQWRDMSSNMSRHSSTGQSPLR
jgi:hypothetical protein